MVSSFAGEKLSGRQKNVHQAICLKKIKHYKALILIWRDRILLCSWRFSSPSSTVFPGALREGNSLPVRKEDLVSDPFSHPQMRKLIGSILILCWDCHFLSPWPVHETAGSCRNQGAEVQTWTLESGSWGHAWGLSTGLKGLWDQDRVYCSALPASLWGKFGKVISKCRPKTQGGQTARLCVRSLCDALKGRMSAT